MCACLSVSYASLFCSQVLTALTDLQAPPTALTPSLSQWHTLLNVCAGSVSISIFPKLVEGMSRLLAFPPLSQQIFLLEPTSPEALAKALMELGNLSRREVRSVTVLGGADCGWLAVVSQWLLSMSVNVIDESGTVIYSHRSLYCASHAQVVLIRSVETTNPNLDMVFTQRSFSVPPGKLCFDIQRHLGDRPLQPFFSTGRSEWSSILHDSFGASIDVLLSPPKNARAFTHFLYCSFSFINDGKGNNHLDPWGGESATARERQRSHMSFASSRLPELAPTFAVGENNAPDEKFGVIDGDTFPREVANICRCHTCKWPKLCFEDIGCGSGQMVERLAFM